MRDSLPMRGQASSSSSSSSLSFADDDSSQRHHNGSRNATSSTTSERGSQRGSRVNINDDDDFMEDTGHTSITAKRNSDKRTGERNSDEYRRNSGSGNDYENDRRLEYNEKNNSRRNSNGNGNGRERGRGRGRDRDNDFILSDDDRDYEEDDMHSNDWSGKSKKQKEKEQKLFGKKSARLIFNSDQLSSFCSLAQCYLLLKTKDTNVEFIIDLLKIKIQESGSSSSTVLLTASETFLLVAERLAVMAPTYKILGVS